jgi:hypothetical protein
LRFETWGRDLGRDLDGEARLEVAGFGGALMRLDLEDGRWRVGWAEKGDDEMGFGLLESGCESESGLSGVDVVLDIELDDILEISCFSGFILRLQGLQREELLPS